MNADEHQHRDTFPEQIFLTPRKNQGRGEKTCMEKSWNHYKYEYYADGTACITKYSGKDAELVIPDTLDGHPVTSIGNDAFYYCTSLTAVTIPSSVTAIGANPFRCCSELVEINVSPAHPTLEVKDGVLFDKTKKRLVTYPCAFSTRSYSIPQGIREIGGRAFAACVSLTAVTIPDSVTSIGANPFAG